MIPTINAAKRIFKSMPDQTRKAIINECINVRGMKSPMTKFGRQCAVEEYGRPNTGERNFLPLLFEHSVKERM
jgi:hypothetical protein